MNIEDQIKAALYQALRGIPELNGCLPSVISVTARGLAYHVELDVPMPISFAGA